MEEEEVSLFDQLKAMETPDEESTEQYPNAIPSMAEVEERQSPDLFRQVDAGEAPIKFQNESQVFDGSTYDDADTPEAIQTNQALYENTGESFDVFGIPTGIRYQKSTNADGQERTNIVPEPWMAEPGVEQSIDRAVVGGVIQGAKETAGFGEWLFDSMQYTPEGQEPSAGAQATKAFANWADQLLGTELSNEDVNWIDENFATLPAQNDLERIGMDIVSMVAGGIAGGAGSAATIARNGNPTVNAIAKLTEGFWKKANEVDTANAYQKSQLFAQRLVTEFGSNLGATVAAPVDAESFSGQFMPEELGNLSEDETNAVGQFVDNTAASGVIGAVKMAITAGGKVINQVIGKGGGSEAARSLSHTKELFEKIDPNVKGASDEEVANRLNLFSEMVRENKDFTTTGPMSVNIERGAARTISLGARNYVDKAYSYLRNQMGPGEFDTWANEQARLISDNIAAERRDNLSSTIVQTADAQTADKGYNALDTASSNITDQEGITASGQELGQSVLNRYQDADDLATRAQQGVTQADLRLKAAQDQGQVIQDFAGPRDALGSRADLDERMANLTGPEFYNAMAASIRETDNKFAEIPDGVDFNREGLANVIFEGGQAQSVLERLNIRTPKGPIRNGTPEGTIAEIASGDDAYAQLLTNLEDMDLKQLYTQVRPALSEMLDDMGNNPVAGQIKKPLINIKKFIDDSANNSGDPSFSNAMDGYRTDMDLLKGFSDYGNYRDNVRGVMTSGSAEKGYGDVLEQGQNLFDQAANSTSGRRMEGFTNVLTRYNENNTEELGNLLLANAARDLSNAVGEGGKVSAEQMVQSLQPYLRSLERTNPDAVIRYRDIVQNLESAQAGLTSAQTAVAQADLFASELKANADMSVASRFLTENYGQGKALADAGAVSREFERIFTNSSDTTQLIKEAQAVGDPAVMEGIEAQYLNWLRDRVFTRRPISSDGKGGAIVESSGSNLGKLLDGSDETGRAVMEAVFASKPEFLADLKMVLGELHADNVGRQIRPQTFSSNTAVDLSRKAAWNAAITFGFGTLSRAGATLRNVSNAITGSQNKEYKDFYEKVTANLLTDSTYLSEMLDKLAANGDQGLYEEFGRFLASTVEGNTIKAVGNANLDGELDRQTDEAFETED